MPTEEVEFDELLTSIDADYIAPEDYDKGELSRHCDEIPPASRGKFEIAYETDPEGTGDCALLTITHLPLSGDREVLFQTRYEVEDILPGPLPGPPEDEVPPVPPPWPDHMDHAVAEPQAQYGEPQYDMENVLTEGEIGAARGRSEAVSWQESEPRARGEAATSRGAPESFGDVMQSARWWPTYVEWANGPGYAGESVAFLSDVTTNYRSNPTWEWLDWIVGQYIAENAPQLINLPYTMFVPLRSLTEIPLGGRQGAPAADVFDAAVQEIKNLLSGDYRNFSKLYPE